VALSGPASSSEPHRKPEWGAGRSDAARFFFPDALQPFQPKAAPWLILDAARLISVTVQPIRSTSHPWQSMKQRGTPCDFVL
jgi:hypothetical protein